MKEYKRVLINIALFLLILLAPYWLYMPALLIACVLEPFYWEGVVYAVLIDILYGRGGSFFHAHLFGIIVLVLVLAMVPLRERFRL
jgi:hypothetical protein